MVAACGGECLVGGGHTADKAVERNAVEEEILVGGDESRVVIRE